MKVKGTLMNKLEVSKDKQMNSLSKDKMKGKANG
jgi:hypothetical protein